MYHLQKHKFNEKLLRKLSLKNLYSLEELFKNNSFKFLRKKTGKHVNGFIVSSSIPISNINLIDSLEGFLRGDRSSDAIIVEQIGDSYRVFKRNNSIFIIAPDFQVPKKELMTNKELKTLEKNRIFISKEKRTTDIFVTPLIKNKEVIKIFKKYQIDFIEYSELTQSI